MRPGVKDGFIDAQIPEPRSGRFGKTAARMAQVLGDGAHSDGLASPESALAARARGVLRSPGHVPGRPLQPVLEQSRAAVAVAAQRAGQSPLVTRLQKAGRIASDIGNLPRAMMTSGDIAAPFRQAAVLTIARPKLAMVAAGEMARSGVSKEAYARFVDKLGSRPEFETGKNAGLYLGSHLGEGVGGIGQREEAFISRLSGKIPIVAGSERAYTSYLDSIRSQAFDSGVREIRKAGLSSAELEKSTNALADWVNTATGRAHLGKLEPAATVLNATLFSPRMAASRVKLLNPAYYAQMPKTVRVQAMKDMLAFGGTTTGLAALAHAAGAHVETDPTSSHFGRVRFGDSPTEVDPYGGLGEYVRFANQIITGQQKLATGDVKPLDGSGKHGATRGSVAERFAESRTNPAVGFLIDALRGTTINGEPFKLSDEAARRLAPIYLQDMGDAIREGGADGLKYAAPAAVGVGVRTPSKGNLAKDASGLLGRLQAKGRVPAN